MAQFILVEGSSFGNGHTDNPTYAFTVGVGDIFLSGSGGYVNTPTGITKATLTSPGVKLKVSDDTITAVTCSVESGYTCTGESVFATWDLGPSPTPSSSPAVSNVTIELSAGTQESSTYPEYTVVVAMDGFKSATRVVQQTSASPVTDSFDLIVTGTITGTGTVTVSRTAPDATVFDGTDITIGQLDGFTTSPTDKTFTIGQTLTNESFSVSGFDLGEDMTINITEG